MTARALFRVLVDGAPRLARGSAESGPRELLPATVDLDSLLAGGPDALPDALDGPAAAGPVPPAVRVLAPVASQEVWASGVTFARSREARNEEAGPVDFYDRVYEAERPELFAKATPGRVRGPGDPVGIRADSDWDVPEPELGLVANSAGRLVAYTVGNDVSSRSIEAVNPLYLPQAKVFTGSCALGPALVPVADVAPLEQLTVRLAIDRRGETVFTDSVSLADLRRTPEELLGWLFQSLEFPAGVVLLSGTSIVPPAELTLAPDDVVRIEIRGIGVLVNPVERVGRTVTQLRERLVRR